MKIHKKLTIGFLSVAFFVIIVGCISIFFSKKALKKSIGENTEILAQGILDSIENDIQQRLVYLQVYTQKLKHNKIIIDSNKEFDSLENPQKYIQEKDSAWISGAKIIQPFIKELQNNTLSHDLKAQFELKQFYKAKYGFPIFEEIFITNKYGANIAFTNIISDYYQADEKWWQLARRDGTFTGKVEYDASVNTYSIAIAVRIDSQDGDFIGIIKAVVNIEDIINIIKQHEKIINTKYGITSNFLLFNEDGTLIYSTDRNISVCKSEALEKNNAYKHVSWIISKDNKIIVQVHSKYPKSDKAPEFRLFLELPAGKVLGPVTELENLIITFSVFIFLFAMGLGMFLSKTLALPIIKMANALKKVGEGNCTGTQINIISTDEIGELASSFNTMTRLLKEREIELKTQREELEKANSDLTRYKGHLEELIGEKTDELKKQKIKLMEATLSLQCELEEHKKLAKFPEEDPNPVLSVSRDGTKILYKNRIASFMLGTCYPTDENKDILPEELKQQSIKAFNAGQLHYEEFECRLGKIFLMAFAPDLELGSVNIYGMDITDQKKAQTRLAENEKYLTNILSAITFPIYLIDVNDYSVNLLNSAAKKLAYGNKEENLKCYQLSHHQDTPCSSDVHPCPLNIMMKTKEPVVLEHVHSDENGNPRIVELHAFPIFDSDGNIVKAVESCIDITARRKMEEDLRITQFAVDHSADAIFLMDSGGQFKYVNTAACKLLGYTEKELLSMTVSDIDSEHSGDIWHDHWEFLKKNLSITVEANYEKKNGDVFPVEITSNYLEYKGYEYNYIFVRNITARKKAEDALTKAEQEKATILRSISELVIYLDANQNILWANQAAMDTFKKTAEELKNLCLCEVICKCRRKGYCGSKVCPVKKIGTTRQLEEIEHVSNDGKIWAMKCYPVIGGANEGTVVIAQDITAQKETESELLRVHTAIGEAMEAIIMTNMEGHATYINRAFTDLLGYTLNDLKKKTISSIYAEDEEENKNRTAIQNDDRYGGWQWNTHILKSDGTAIPVLIRATPIPDKNDIPVEMLFIITDMTHINEEGKKRKQLETRLVQAQKMEAIGRLAAGIAHEINTPTQFVGDNIKFLQDSFGSITKIIEVYKELLDPEKKKEEFSELFSKINEILEKEDIEYLNEEIPKAIAQSIDGMKRIADIVLAMKEFSHPKVGEKKINDINKAIEDTLTVSRNEWKYVADVKTDFTEASHMIYCYPSELNQVLLNMFVNAAHTIADANRERQVSKGLITVKTERTDTCFRISITDTGMGIPEEIRPKIFDMFFTTKEMGKGTGQGLALAYDVIVNKHAGRLTFDTETGKGTTFHLELPLA